MLFEASPSNAAALRKHWPITKPASFLASGILGWAFPSSVGAALAEHTTGSKRPAILVIDDGALQ